MVNMNNVYVTHKCKEVSIAQHRQYDDFPIIMYGNSLDSLINRLMEIRDEIDKAHIHKPSSEGNAATAQVTASSTA